MSIITRKEYLAASHHVEPAITHNIDPHRIYYRQFVTDETLQQIEAVFSKKLLTTALHDGKHLNRIPIDRWDRLCFTRPQSTQGPFTALLAFNRDAVIAAGDSVTRSTLVCIAKEAARMTIDDIPATDHPSKEATA